MAQLFDPSTEFGQRVARRLREESVIWLTTVGADLTPQPRPVWFLWNGETFLIYSQPAAHKVAHLARHPCVALSFNSDESGNDVVVFIGDARLVAGPLPEEQASAYLAKYREGIAGLGMSEAQMIADYSSAILVTPRAVRGF